jgi:hypothetical protein
VGGDLGRTAGFGDAESTEVDGLKDRLFNGPPLAPGGGMSAKSSCALCHW